MNNLESKFKNALENHEVQYDPQAWSSFKEQLDAGSGASGGGSSILTKLGIAATVVSAVSIGAYFLFSSDSKENSKSKQEQTELVEVAEDPNQKEVNEGPISPETNHVKATDENNPESELEKVEKHDEISEIENSPYKHKDIKKEDSDEKNFNFFKKDEDSKKENKDLTNVEDKTPSNVSLNAGFTINRTSGCEGMVCEFKPTNIKTHEGDIVWDFGDGSFSKEKYPVHTFKKAGNYVVRLTLRSEINNKVLSDYTEEYVSIYNNPEVDFEIEEQSSNTSIPEFSFINLTDNADRWTWTFGDGTNSSKKDPSHTFRKKGIYNVKLTATNAFGCKSSVSKKVNVEDDYNLLAPTAFTPNGDGRNDYFIPRALEIMNADFTMSVFHKNGQLYYETNQVSRPWDGRYMKDNQNAPGGAYVWIVKVKNKDGETEIYRGSVTLLRD